MVTVHSVVLQVDKRKDAAKEAQGKLLALELTYLNEDKRVVSPIQCVCCLRVNSFMSGVNYHRTQVVNMLSTGVCVLSAFLC